MMRIFFTSIFILLQLILWGQQFDCDGTFYLILYKESEGVTKLYEIEEEGQQFKFYETILSEKKDISESHPFRIQDIAIDPIFGEIYGYNNLEGSIVQLGVDGQVSTISSEAKGEQ